uniref:Uncharacterized protein n=1 Tax=Nelumbo nucifera TaxID=4432 RepID=A0A822YF56_NELNU|nr:TPA_asm: hypothetical protein HUJ06_031579 [Nelumbo nucifera]
MKLYLAKRIVHSAAISSCLALSVKYKRAMPDTRGVFGSGLLNIDLIASSTFEMVRAGLQPSFKIPKLKFPSASTLQW